MSKDLNNEYKKHIENEIPDLWNRIEEALPSKYIEPESTSVEEPKPETNAPVEFKSEGVTNKKKKNRIGLYAGLIAACACLISIPAFLRMDGMMSPQYAASAAKSDDAMMAESAEASYDMEAAEEYEEAAGSYDAEASESYEAEAEVAEEAEAVMGTEADVKDKADIKSEAAMSSEEAAEEAPAEISEAAEEATNGADASDLEYDVAVSVEGTENADSSDDDVKIMEDLQVSVKRIYERNGIHYASMLVIKDPGKNLTLGDVVEVDISFVVSGEGKKKKPPFEKGDKLTVQLAQFHEDATDAIEYILLEITELKK